MKLILGSASKYRKEILKKAGYDFEVLVSDIDEKSIKAEDPYQRPLILARAKADTLISQVKEEAIIITSDTVIIAEGNLYEKPETEKEAREFLKKYSEGIVPSAVTAVVVVNAKTGEKYEGIDIAKVSFKPFSDLFIEDFIKSGEPFKLAGGFGVLHPLMKPYIDKVEGTEESIAGMPVQLLKKLLKQAGY